MLTAEEMEGVLADAMGCYEEAKASHAWGPAFTYSKAQEAFVDAHKVLVASRKAGSMATRVKALSTVVKSCLLMGDTFDAMRFAQDELAMVNRSNKEDLVSRADITDMVSEALEVRGDFGGALALNQDALELRKESKDKKLEAKAILRKAEIKLQLNQAKEAVEIAEQAVKMCKECKDAAGEENATRVLAHAYCEKGQPERAPHREQALKALQGLESSLTSMDAQTWAINESLLVKSGAYTQRELDDVITKMLSKEEDNRRSLTKFLEEQGIDMDRYGGAPGSFATQVSDMDVYVPFRMSGMTYGPRFRTMQQIHLVGRENEPAQKCFSVIKMDVDDTGTCGDVDGWEKDMVWHPGLLDGLLHTAETYKSH